MSNDTTQPSRSLPAWVMVLLLFLTTFSLFFSACSGAFLNWDDDINVAANPHYLPTTVASIGQFWTKPYNELYTPVTNTLWAVCAVVPSIGKSAQSPGSVLPLEPFPFHLLGVLVHATTTVLVFLLLRRLTRNDIASLVGASFWGIHPLQVESVAWITGNNNVFCGFFSVLTLLLYVRAVQENRSLAGGAFTYLLALLAKPTGVAVPLMIAALELFVLRRPIKRWLPAFLTGAAIAIVLAVFTRMSSPASAVIKVDLWKRPIIALDALAFYFGKILFPSELAVDYGRLPDHVAFSWWGYACVGVTIGVIAVCVFLWRQDRRIPLSTLALLLAGVFPVLGLVPYYFLRISTVADRYLYLALLGPALGIALGITQVPTRWKQSSFVVAGVVLLTLSGRTLFQIPVWHDSTALFTHAISINPESALSHNNLYIVLSAQGKAEDALKEATRAAELAPDNAEYINNLGIAYAEKGDLARAIASFQEAIRLQPKDPDSHYHLGVALVDSGNSPAAVPAFQEAVRLNPQFTEAWYRLGTTLGKIGPASAAIDALAKSLALRPNDTEARYIRAVLLTNEKRNTEAEAEFVAVTQAMPNYAEAWYALGTVQMRLGKTAEARTTFEQCLRLAPTNAKAKAALAKLPK